MPTPVDSISHAAMLVPAAFGADAPAAGVSPAEFAAVFRQYSATNVDEPRKDDAVRISHINMGLRVVGTVFVDDAGGRSWWAY
jgi:hypothetical protein